MKLPFFYIIPKTALRTQTRSEDKFFRGRWADGERQW